MSRFIIKSAHTAEECKMAVKHFQEYHAGYLSHFEWGCYDNDHTAYLIVEAENHEEAMQSVPPLFRPKATATKLVYFNPKSKGDPVHSK